MNTLSVCPSTLQSGFSTYSTLAIKHLFDGKKVSHLFNGPDLSKETGEREPVINYTGRISVSGVQPKFSVIIGEDNRLRYTKDEEQGTYILKTRPEGSHLINKDYAMANENLTMQLAGQIYKINTAQNGLCFFEDDFTPAYITRRFDVYDGGKYPMEDFAALMGFSKESHGVEYKYHQGSYEECGEVIKNFVKAPVPALLQLFRIVAFNFLVLNDDAHLKNFSLIEKDGEYMLAPAYDLLNTSLHLYEPNIFALKKGLFKEGMQLTDTRTVKREDFEELARRFNLPKKAIKKEMERFLTPYAEAEAMIFRSFLSEELKQKYFDSYSHRRKMLTW